MRGLADLQGGGGGAAGQPGGGGGCGECIK